MKSYSSLVKLPCSKPLKSYRESGSEPPLFCIYGVLLYDDLARNLGTEQPVYGVYLEDEVNLIKAGRLEKKNELISVAEIATRYLKEIRTLQPVGPYFLAGESFGGLVAFEMAQQLHLQGEKVGLVILFDTQAPGSVKKLPVSDRFRVHSKNLLREGSTYALKQVGWRINSSKDRVVSIISRIYTKFDQGGERSWQRYLQEVAINYVRERVCEQAASNYVPHPYPGKMVLFRALERDQFEAYSDPQLGWSSLAAGGLEVHDVPGDHIGIIKEPHVQVLAAKLKACLEEAQVADF